MPRGNPNIKDYSVISGSNVDISEDDNKTYLDMLQESFNVSKPDLQDPLQVNRAIQAYFERCYKHNLRPGNMGIYNALGITRQDVNDYLNGKRKAPNSAFIDTLKKIKSSMAEYRELLGTEGKINPATLIFWQKNHDSFTDVQQLEITSTGAPTEEKSVDELRQKMLEDMPIESDYREV